MITTPIRDVDGVILAGGAGSRLKDSFADRNGFSMISKASIRFGSKSIVDHVVEIFRQTFTKVMVLSNESLQLEDKSVTVVSDQYLFDRRSSLVGIFNAIQLSEKPWVCIGACDMPFIPAELLRLLAAKRTDKDLVIPLHRQYLQPLPAVYGVGCKDIIEDQLRQGNHRVLDFFPKVSLEIVTDEMMDSVGVDPESFLNINTVEQYKQALEIQRLRYP